MLLTNSASRSATFAGIVSTAVTVLLTFAQPAAHCQAELIGHLEQLSPAPQTYVQAVDFETFFDSGNAAIGDVIGQLQWVPNFGSVPTDFAGFTPGNLALIERGESAFSTKVNNATAAGAAGVLIFDNVPNQLISGSFADIPTMIPAVITTQLLGQQLFDQLANGEVLIRLSVSQVPEPSGVLLLFIGLAATCAHRRKLTM
jgi:PA domain